MKTKIFTLHSVIVFLFTVSTNVSAQTLNLSTPVSGDPNGGNGNANCVLYAGSGGTGTLYVKQGANVQSMAVDKNGRVGFSSYGFNFITMYDPSTGKAITGPPMPKVTAMTIEPNAEYAYLSSGQVATTNPTLSNTTVGSTNTLTVTNTGSVTVGNVVSGVGITTAAGSPSVYVTASTTTSVTLSATIAATASNYTFTQPVINRYLWSNTGLSSSFGYHTGDAVSATQLTSNQVQVIPFIYSGDLVYYNGADNSTTTTRTPFYFSGMSYGFAFDASGNLYISDRENQIISKISIQSYSVTTSASAGAATLTMSSVAGLTVGMLVSGLYIPKGTYITSITANDVTLSNATSGGTITSTSGSIAFITGASLIAGTGVAGKADGTASSATFNQPCGLAFDKSGNLYVADKANITVRKIIASAGVVSSSSMVSSFSTGLSAQWVNVDPTGGFLYVGENTKGFVYKIPLSTGVKAIYYGSANALQVAACTPSTTAATITTASSTAQLVSGMYVFGIGLSTSKVAKITGIVSPISYTNYAGATVNGTAAGSVTTSYASPDGVITAGAGYEYKIDGLGVDPVTGDVYFADGAFQIIRKISNSSVLSTIADGNDWNTPASWTVSTIPTTTNDAIVLHNTSVNTNPTATVVNLNVEAGKTLTIANGVTLTVTGNVVNNGTITCTGTGKLSMSGASKTYFGSGVMGNLEMTGTGTPIIASGITLGSLAISNVTVSLEGALTITGDLNINSGTLSTGANTLTLKGAISGTGYINTGTSGTLALGGTVEQILAASNLTSGVVNLLTINAGSKLTTSGIIGATTFNILSDGINGTGTLKDGGTFTATTANVNQYLGSARNWYVSSPISNAAAPAGYTFYKYLEPGNNVGFTNPATAYWENIASGSALASGTGFIAQASGTTTIVFSGTLNTSNVPVSLTRTGSSTKPGFNLIGNPYPSYLNIDALASNPDLEPTYWFRCYNGGYVFDTYNIPSSISTGLSGNKVSANISPMQAFWVRVKNTSTSGSIIFTNSMRGHQDDAGNKFRAPSAIKSVQKVLRLQVSNGVNKDEAVVYFNPNASDSYDIYDSPKMSNGNVAIPEIFTQVGSEQLVINGLNSITPDKVVTLGFTTGQANSFELKATELSNFDAGTQVLLVDNVTGTQTDLTAGSTYSFTSDETSTLSRFGVLFKTQNNTTDKNNNSAIDPTISIYKNVTDQIVVDCKAGINSESSVAVYNVAGQLLTANKLTSSVTRLAVALVQGVYTVKVFNNGKTTTKKIIL